MDQHEYFVIFNSADSSVAKEENGYRFSLKTPLEFSTEWEVGVKQILIKPPFEHKNTLGYVHMESPDDKGVTKSIDLGKPDTSLTKKELVEYFNNKLPVALRKDVYLTIDDNNIANLHIVDKHIQLGSDYFGQVLGLPLTPYKGTGFIKGERAVKYFSHHPVFHILLDIVAPVPYGSKLSPVVATDIFSKETGYKNYNYAKVAYHKIVQNYISSFLISTTDIEFNFFESKDPLLIKFHFRRLLVK